MCNINGVHSKGCAYLSFPNSVLDSQAKWCAYTVLHACIKVARNATTTSANARHVANVNSVNAHKCADHC